MIQQQIKYRGKTKDGYWVSGPLIPIVDEDSRVTAYAIGNSDCLVDENTLCQFTGLFDINSSEIYEGDILQDDVLHNSFVVGRNKCGLCIFSVSEYNNFKNKVPQTLYDAIATIQAMIYIEDNMRIVGNIIINDISEYK